MPGEAQIVVSAHFDDAALSLAHLLQRAGSSATVVTVCGGAPPPGRTVGEWDAEAGFRDGREAARLRALEDRRACAVTGARRVRLRHRDAPYRERRLLARPLRAAVERLLDGGGVLWLPAAIGGHPDHLDVRDALLPLARGLPPARVRVYADLPYAGESGYRLPAAVAAALPGLRPADVRMRGGAWERKLAAVRCHASQIAPLQAHGAPGLLARDGVLARERAWSASCDPLADPRRAVILQL
ncbi:MAG TPA: PIG-L family deacetylase [Gaiellales bacterium]